MAGRRVLLGVGLMALLLAVAVPVKLWGFMGTTLLSRITSRGLPCS